MFGEHFQHTQGKIIFFFSIPVEEFAHPSWWIKIFTN